MYIHTHACVYIYIHTHTLNTGYGVSFPNQRCSTWTHYWAEYYKLLL